MYGLNYVYEVGVVFFFKQKTAYEMLRSLVGSEMCIRDRNAVYVDSGYRGTLPSDGSPSAPFTDLDSALDLVAVSYTHLTLPTIYSV